MSDVTVRVIEQPVVVEMSGGIGPSHYDLWLADGNVGSLEDFFNDMVSQLNLTVTSAPGQTVSTRALLAAIASPANGQPARLDEPGREGDFRFSTANHSTNVTADPYQGLYVAPSSDTDGSSGAWVRVREDGYLRAAWYGVSAGNTEATNTAIMDSILAANLPGNFCVVVPNAVVPMRVKVPAVGGTTISVVEIRGDASPSTMFGTLPGYTMSAVGPMLTSAATAATPLSGGVIEVLPNGGTFSNVKLIVRNLGVRPNDNNHGINAIYASQLIVNNVAIDTGVWSTSVPLPTNPRYGLSVPAINNAAFTAVRDTSINGLFVAMNTSEHLVVDNVAITACKYGFEFLDSNHAFQIGRVGIYRTQVPIVVSGACRFRIEHLDIEHVNVGHPDEHGPAWQETTDDLFDDTNLSRGTINYASILGHVAGDSGVFTRNGGMGVEVIRIGYGDAKTARFNRTSNLSLTTSVQGSIPFTVANNTQSVSLDPAHSNRILFNEYGTYRATLNGSFAASGTGLRRLRIVASDGTTLGEATFNAAAGVPTSFPVVAVFTISAASVYYIEATAEQQSGGNLDLVCTPFLSSLTVEKISG